MRRTSIALATFLFSAALSAQNVIPNPDLTTGIAGWSLLQVTGTGWSQTEGDPDPGSLEITNVGGFGEQLVGPNLRCSVGANRSMRSPTT